MAAVIERMLSGAIDRIDYWRHQEFDSVPRRLMRHAYGVDYVQLDDEKGGRLWVTRHGWSQLAQLDPARWYAGQQYSRQGTRLADGSGAVYRVPGISSGSRSRDLVVKFSRVAQDVQLYVPARLAKDWPEGALSEAAFNDPFQEFGLVEELRRGQFGPATLRILTKRPLAIYSSGRRLPDWQSGREASSFRRNQKRLSDDQAQREVSYEALDIALDRQYVTLFQWVHGIDVQRLVELGRMSRAESVQLVRRAVRELAAKGFRMLDMKPNHLIVRMRADGRLVQRRGRIAYVLVDFELLQRTAECAARRHT